MISINGLPPSGPHSVNRLKRQPKTKKVAENATIILPAQTSQNIIQRIEYLNDAEYDRVRVEYDLPHGQGRRALEAYLRIMHHSKREELMRLLGVDIYV